MNPAGTQLYLFYDSECPLCRGFGERVERWDRRGAIEVWSLDEAATEACFAHLDLERARLHLTVCNRLGTCFEGVEALRQLARLLPGIGRLGWIYRLPGMRPAAGGAYRMVHRYRKRLCLSCGEKWMPSHQYSRRRRG